MTEVQSRTQNPTTRGRGGGRGGRGGFGGRNTTARRANGDKTTAFESPAVDDDGDIAQLRKQHGDKLGLIKELFEDWSDADILYALKETDGDVELTATRIADVGEVSKTKKPAARPKAKPDNSSTGPAESTGANRPARGGRSDGARGRGARGNERARGAGRGRGAAHTTTNGHRTKDGQLSVPTDEASAWGSAISADESPSSNDWSNATSTAVVDSTTNNTPLAPSSTTTESAPKPATTQAAPKTWASMLRQSTTPKVAPKPKEAPVPKPAEPLEPLPSADPAVSEPEPESKAEETPTPVEAPVEPSVSADAKIVEPEVALPPSEDDLTKMNLDLLPDTSNPPATATAASTTADSWDIRQPQQQQSAAVTPLSASHAQHQAGRQAASGYVASALKATERPAARTPSYQRRLLEQEEAVRMPGNREVDRAAVQFGAFSLNGAEDDIDGDREDPETRTQPPAESPAAPRASLPPIAQPAAVPESLASTQKIPTSQPSAPVTGATPVAPPTGPASSTAQPPQAPSSNAPYGRFPQGSSHEPAGFPQKPYDTFTQQPVSTSAGFDSFPTTTSQAPGPQAAGAFSSGPNDYSSYYNADQQSRNTYGGYYAYGQQQGGQNHGEPNATSRQYGAYNASQTDNLNQYPQSGSQQSRYPGATSADAHNSGHNTPNPVGQSQQQVSAQGTQPQSNIHQQQPSYPYQQHPYYTSPYYAQYMSQPYGGYGQGGYGGGPYGKGGLYGQGHQYGMSPQGPFDHGSSAATAGFGQSSISSRETGLTSGINEYGRGGSAQQSGAPAALGGGGFGGAVHDSYGRGAGFPSQGGQAYNAGNAPTATPGSGNDDLKPYGDSKAAGGPSPLAAAARPGSTTNASPATSGLPPPQSTQQSMGGYGGYPSHLSQGLHGGQTGTGGYGLGGSSNQGHGNTPYGSYNANQSFGSYYQGRQGHQGGWGGNYH
ncbi:hypothetical protein F4808DRAFT_469488 [Astrocystis sublimbata]|nr:hypothetical protein F4808DRAFT_469488 [Astrocystis sublimbata]